MAAKTISIDLEAYRRLKSAQRDSESISQTIKRVVRKPFDAEAWLKKLSRLSPQAVDAVERQLSNRRRPSGRLR